MTRATSFDVAVRGSDAATYVFAVECARYGFRVAVDDRAKCYVPESFADYDGTIAQLTQEYGVGIAETIQPDAQLSIIGIPGNPFAPGVVARFGWRGAWRLYLDRLRPLLQIGNETDCGRLVRKRLGRPGITLVSEALAHDWGVSNPDGLAIDEVAPGIVQAMSRVGSLTSGVLELVAAEPRWGTRVEVVGGTEALIDAIVAQADYFAVTRGINRDEVVATIVVDDVAADSALPNWSRQVVRAREKARRVRRELLTHPENPPVGPVDLER